MIRLWLFLVGKSSARVEMFAYFVLLLLLWIPQRLKSCSFLCLRSNVHQGVGIMCHLPSMSAVKILSRRRVSWCVLCACHLSCHPVLPVTFVFGEEFPQQNLYLGLNQGNVGRISLLPFTLSLLSNPKGQRTMEA